jgi:hypothetical protein
MGKVKRHFQIISLVTWFVFVFEFGNLEVRQKFDSENFGNKIQHYVRHTTKFEYIYIYIYTLIKYDRNKNLKINIKYIYIKIQYIIIQKL